MNARTKKEQFDLDQLLHPARAFAHPAEVVKDRDLTLNEKRAILASWASDACAVEDSPGLRQPTDGPPVSFDTIMDALRVLDGEVVRQPRYRRFINRARRIRDLYRPGPDGPVLSGWFTMLEIGSLLHSVPVPEILALLSIGISALLSVAFVSAPSAEDDRISSAD